MRFKSWKKIILIVLIFSSLPVFVQAAEIEFNVDPSYDSSGRTEITAFLHQIGINALFYVEDDYYKKLDIEDRENFASSLSNLSREFDEVIYPKLTKTFGLEWKPGIDDDEKITVLISQIREESGGYFNQGDEYPKAQVPSSNEREMIYLNANYITSPLAKSYLAHEFIHLITFNQKDKISGLGEEIWLNEARAEYAPTLLGYDNEYEGSNLQKRVRTFSQKPDDPLTEWKNSTFDYGVLNIFTQYLIDYYGIKILSDSFLSSKIGIPSLNEALKKNGYSQDFSQIFTDWSITVLVNDCTLSPKYCYLNQNLKNLRILPQLNYLPFGGESTLSLTDYAKNWAGNWYKFIGGKGTLKLEFIGDEKIHFKVPYLSRDSFGKYSISFLDLNDFQRGLVYIKDFGSVYESLTIIPSVQNKISGFDGIENYYQFIWTASVINENSEKEGEKLIQDLLAQIQYLQNEIQKVQAQINAILAQKGGTITCSKFENNLYFGMTNNSEVRCLQEFLKNQGTGIYPEGLVTGNFFSLTEKAVIRFQEKYASEILTSSGLLKGTGIVGPATRAKLNTLF